MKRHRSGSLLSGGLSESSGLSRGTKSAKLMNDSVGKSFYELTNQPLVLVYDIRVGTYSLY